MSGVFFDKPQASKKLSIAQASAEAQLRNKNSKKDSFFDYVESFFFNAKEATQQASDEARKATLKSKEIFLNTAETLGIKDGLDFMNEAVRKIDSTAKKTQHKAMMKAKRLAKKSLDFDEDEGDFDSSDYDLLLSAAGAKEINIAASQFQRRKFVIPPGNTFVWKARVRQHNIGFAIVLLKGKGPDVKEVDIKPLSRYGSVSLIQGSLPPVDKQRTIALVFDNSHSHIQGKRVGFWTTIGLNVSLSDDSIGAARSKEVSAAEQGPFEEEADEAPPGDAVPKKKKTVTIAPSAPVTSTSVFADAAQGDSDRLLGTKQPEAGSKLKLEKPAVSFN